MTAFSSSDWAAVPGYGCQTVIGPALFGGGVLQTVGSCFSEHLYCSMTVGDLTPSKTLFDRYAIQ